MKEQDFEEKVKNRGVTEFEISIEIARQLGNINTTLMNIDKTLFNIN